MTSTMTNAFNLIRSILTRYSTTPTADVDQPGNRWSIKTLPQAGSWDEESAHRQLSSSFDINRREFKTAVIATVNLTLSALEKRNFVSGKIYHRSIHPVHESENIATVNCALNLFDGTHEKLLSWVKENGDQKAKEVLVFGNINFLKHEKKYAISNPTIFVYDLEIL